MSVESEARKALTRLRRAVEKMEHELRAVEGSLRRLSVAEPDPKS